MRTRATTISFRSIAPLAIPLSGCTLLVFITPTYDEILHGTRAGGSHIASYPRLGLTATRNGAVSGKDAIDPMRACVFTAKIRVLGTQFLPPLGATHLDTSCGTASRVWIHGVLARLQVLLGGMVVCHIRFSTTPDTMVVV